MDTERIGSRQERLGTITVILRDPILTALEAEAADLPMAEAVHRTTECTGMA